VDQVGPEGCCVPSDREQNQGGSSLIPTFTTFFAPVLGKFCCARRVTVSPRTQLPFEVLEPVNYWRKAGDQRRSEARKCASRGVKERGIPMKKVLVALVATLVAVSVAGCVGIGKGKAPPPIVTKG
jgi:hypothetical protein